MKTFDNAYKYWKDLPGWAKGVIAVVAAGGVIVGVNWISKKLKKDQNKLESQAANKELTNLSNQGINPNFSDAQFEEWSQGIVSAINECGTDEQAIYNIFSNMKNDADVYKFVSVYGVRSYKPCLENFFGGNVSRSLGAALSDELDSSETAKLNGILSSKGITVQF